MNNISGFKAASVCEVSLERDSKRQKLNKPHEIFENNEIILGILRLADIGSLSSAHLVNKQWSEIAVKVTKEKSFALDDQPFGKEMWQQFFGADVGYEPPLPENIDDILDDQCPYSEKGITVRQSHQLVLIPMTVNGSALNLKTIGELVATRFPRFFRQNSEIENCERVYSEEIFIEHVQREVWPMCESTWVLLTREIIKNSEGARLGDQIKLIKNGGENYELPPAIVAVTCVFAAFAKSFCQTLLFEKGHARCAEMDEVIQDDLDAGNEIAGHGDMNLTFGNFSKENGLTVNLYEYTDYEGVGVAACRLFPNSTYTGL